MKALAKISRPSPAGLFPRNRLFRRLDRSRRKPVIFINGPPGSGKTSLVTSYISVRKLSCLWYQVDVGDSDIASFFYHLGVAAKRAMPGRRKSLPLLTPEYLLGIRAFTLRFFEELYGGLPSVVPAPGSLSRFVIVFDNYQEVADQASFQKIIRDGLSVIPPGITVIVISRNELPEAFASMYANRLMEVVGWDELKLRIEEATGIVRLLQNDELPEDALLEIHRKTQGWAAGLVLLSEQTRTGKIDPLLEGSCTLKELFDYFAGVILEQTGLETRAFLEKTSFFRRFTPEMARELTHNSRAAGILSRLHRNNYFTQRHDNRIVMYEYHNLFREFLLTRTRESSSPDSLSRIRRDAAVVCRAHGQFEDAIDLFLEEGAWESAARLIREQGPALISQGRGMTLSAWIEAMPEAVVRDDPHLLYWRGTCHLPLWPSRGRKDLEKAFHLFEAGRDVQGLFLTWSGIVDSILSEWDDFRLLDPWIEWLDERTSDGSLPPPAVYPWVAVCMVRALTYRRPWHPNIRAWADRARSLSQNHPDPNLRVQACIAVSTYNYFMGEEAQGVLPAREGRRIARGDGVSPLTILGMKFIEIVLHWLTSSTESSSKLISEGLAVAEKSGVHVYDSMLYSYAVYDFLTRGDLAGAGELLRKMESMLGPDQRCALGHYHYVLAWYYYLLDDLPSAAVNAQRGVEIPFETGMPFGEANCRIMLAYVSEAEGEIGKALEQIRLARKIGRKAKSSLLEWLCDLAEAWVAFRSGQEEAGLESLKKGMAVGRARGFMNCEGWLSPVMSELCRKGLENGIEGNYIEELIRRHGLVPNASAYECETWPWPVKIHALGRFEILKDEKPLRYSVRAPRMPLTLLKAIVAFGSGGAKEDHLADALWPESDGDMAHQSLKTTLHRLRQLIGEERAVQVREGRIMLDGQYCWVDAHSFESLLDNAEALWRKNLCGEAVELGEKALSLYQGAFLGEEAHEPWALVYQERLRSKFLRAVDRLGRQFEGDGQWERAVECYRRGLEVDELAEEFYQRLMTSYLSWGRRAEAIAIYNRCRRVLQSVLGIDPSPTTEAILRTVRG